jgi:hypothetical protein
MARVLVRLKSITVSSYVSSGRSPKTEFCPLCASRKRGIKYLSGVRVDVFEDAVSASLPCDGVNLLYAGFTL